MSNFRVSRSAMAGILLFAATATGPSSAGVQQPPRQQRDLPATLGLDHGTSDFSLRDFTLKLVRASQTVAALQPTVADGFDFTPADRLSKRVANGYHHLGDLTLRLRRGTGEWQDYDTAQVRMTTRPLADTRGVLAAADLTPTLRPDCPLQVTRTWLDAASPAARPERGAIDAGAAKRDGLILQFTLKNASADPVEIGGLGIPMVFNNVISDRTLKQAHEICSFFDPYIGQDAGYLQVTRLKGTGPALVVVPEGKTPFEAWMPLNEPTRPNQTFEGAFAWMVHSKGYAEKEWSKADPWNPSTSVTLAPGESRTYGVRFILSPEIRAIEKTLADQGRPVAVGVPGYILPMDQDGRLFLRFRSGVKSTEVSPEGALSVRKEKPTPGGWHALSLRGQKWGRARLTVSYEDGTRQSVHYYVTKPALEAVSDLGRFLFTKQWFEVPNDPFRRSPSVMSYDREADKIVDQDSRVWIAGLGDEGGSGSWLAAGMKQIAQPNEEEIEKYARFVDKVLWGGLQYSDGPNKYGVRKSLFFYEPKEMPEFPYDPARDWRSWTSWNKQHSMDIGRGYNYPHVVAAYWSLYRARRNVAVTPGRNGGQGTHFHSWDWYLGQAFQTTRFAFSRDDRGRRRVGWVELGLMEGTVFLLLLEDLKREGWTEKAAEIEKLMKERADRWRGEEYPFGSEMAWDSTGQEEVYAWCRYFGYDDKALVSLNSILGYMPTVPHWGYNGNARRYWDFLYGGKLTRIERQIHHYGSGLNAIPVLTEFRRNPDDFYLLRVGYGGMMGALTNIDQEGFASAAFHSFPNTLKWDAYSGDYGPNFFGHVVNAGTYVVEHPEFGWQAFGGNVRVQGDWVKVKVLDSVRQRVFVAPHKLWLTLDAGRFDSVEVNRKTGAVRVGLAPGSGMGLLRVEEGGYVPGKALKSERRAYAMPLGRGVMWVELRKGGR